LEKRHIVAIADPYTVYALRLIGVEGYPVTSSEEAKRILKNIELREDVGLVLVSAEIFDEISDAISALQRGRSDLVVARLPTIREPGKPMDVQKELLKALGMG
jgi:V/A-type H+-transporting ATPase subunit F